MLLTWESELRAIAEEAARWPIETGGDLFGLWEPTPTICLATRTGPRAEIGDRQPSMGMLEKLARVFKVTIEALLHDKVVAVKLLTFDAGQAFPLGQPFTIPFIGLMMATDDARHLQKLLIIAREKVVEAPEAEKTILNGELGHLFRLLCGHLHEAKGAFLALDTKNPGLVDAAVQDDAAGKAALAYVRSIYQQKPARKQKPFIDAVRNFVAFHYNEAMIARALRKHLTAGHLEGTLTLSPHAGIGRYTMADTLATLMLSDELGGQIGDFQQRFMQKVEEVIKLAGALGLVVDHLAGYLLFEKNSQEVKTEDATVRVDPLIERARRAVEVVRRSGAPAVPPAGAGVSPLR